MNFSAAFDVLLSPTHEGGYAPPREGDPGGETKFGVSKRSYPHLDIPNLTREQVRPIYLHDYWGPAGCDAVHNLLKFPLFDFAVNSGPKTAVKELQKLVGEFPDGIIGPRTMGGIEMWDPLELAVSLNCARLDYMTTLSNWVANSKGWTRRINSNIRLAFQEAHKP